MVPEVEKLAYSGQVRGEGLLGDSDHVPVAIDEKAVEGVDQLGAVELEGMKAEFDEELRE